MALSSSNAAKQLSDGNSQGTILGQSANDKISFYNATPVAKSTIVTAQVTNAAVVGSSSTAFGFYNSSQANMVLAAIQQLQTLGLC